MLKAGKLRHRITIQQQVEVQNPDNGAMSVDWSNVATVWAAIEPLSAKEFIASESETSKITTRVTIRFRTDVTAKMRLLHNKKGVDFYYNVEGVLPDKDSGLEYLTLPCSEGVRYEVGDIANNIPVNEELPFIFDVVGVGLHVQGYPGTWDNTPTSYLYQWYLDGQPIIGANGTITGDNSTDFVVPDSIGSQLTFGVVAVNINGNSDIIFSGSKIITDSSNYLITDNNILLITDDEVLITAG